MRKEKELTRYAFLTHMTAFVKALLKHPTNARVDEFLKSKGIDEVKAVEMLTTPIIDGDPDSRILRKKEKIKKNEEGKDVFVIQYSLLPGQYTNKMRNLYISRFEDNIVESVEQMGNIKETTSAGSSGQFVGKLNDKPIRRKVIFMTEEQVENIKKQLKETDCASVGNFAYDAPCFGDKNDPAYNHKDLFKRLK